MGTEQPTADVSDSTAPRPSPLCARKRIIQSQPRRQTRDLTQKASPAACITGTTMTSPGRTGIVFKSPQSEGSSQGPARPVTCSIDRPLKTIARGNNSVMDASPHPTLDASPASPRLWRTCCRTTSATALQPRRNHRSTQSRPRVAHPAHAAPRGPIIRSRKSKTLVLATA